MAELTREQIERMLDDAIGLNPRWSRVEADKLRDMAVRTCELQNLSEELSEIIEDTKRHCHNDALLNMPTLPSACAWMRNEIDVLRAQVEALKSAQADAYGKLDAIAKALNMPVESWHIAGSGCDVLAHQIIERQRTFAQLVELCERQGMQVTMFKCSVTQSSAAMRKEKP